MQQNTLALNLARFPITAPIPTQPAPARGNHQPIEHRRNRGPAPSPSSARLELAAACAREMRAEEKVETASLLFLAACAFTVIGGCILQLEQSAAHWAWFENLVRHVL